MNWPRAKLANGPYDRCAVACLLLICLVGCEDDPNSIGRFEKTWARRGISDGRFQKPRAIAIDQKDRIYVVDLTARVQAFDTDGNFLCGWRTPEFATGKPTGLGVDRDGNILVADTHYYRILIYSPEGELLRKIDGEVGTKPGEFYLIRDVVQDSQGNYYFSEMGEFDRIQKFSKDGEFLLQWGEHGPNPGQFIRPESLAVDENDNIWVADACNHRIQAFDTEGNLVKLWGSQGDELGELYYPYDLVFDPEGNLYVCEYGNHRVQKFTKEGESLGAWGTEGRGEGQLFNPWGLTRDSKGRIHVVDTYNHRVHKVKM